MVEIYTILTVQIIKMHRRACLEKESSHFFYGECFVLNEKAFVMQKITPKFWFVDWGGEAWAAADRRPAHWEGV